jgi:hypothetical protein
VGRGLSELQKSILKMAHERFVEDMERYDAGEVRGRVKGIHYDVNVGPVLPSPFSLESYYSKRAYQDKRVYELTDEEFEQHRERVYDSSLKHVREKRDAVEAQFREAAPELFEPDSQHKPRWSAHSELLNDVHYEVLEVGMGTLNDAPGIRRLESFLKEKGLDAWRTWLGGGFLYTWEILRDLYNFEPSDRSYHEYYAERYGERGQRRRDFMKFDPAQIGEERYNRTRATVSRAVKRLNDRVLIDAGYGSVTITLEGVAEVTGLTVKEVCTQHNLNQRDIEGNLIRHEREQPLTEEELAERTKAARELQNTLNPPPPPLADAFAAVIAQYAAYYQREPTGEEIEEALERAKVAD